MSPVPVTIRRQPLEAFDEQDASIADLTLARRFQLKALDEVELVLFRVGESGAKTNINKSKKTKPNEVSHQMSEERIRISTSITCSIWPCRCNSPASIGRLSVCGRRTCFQRLCGAANGAVCEKGIGPLSVRRIASDMCLDLKLINDLEKCPFSGKLGFCCVVTLICSSPPRPISSLDRATRIFRCLHPLVQYFQPRSLL